MKLRYLTGATKAPKKDDPGFSNMGLIKLHDHGMISEIYGVEDKLGLHVFTKKKKKKLWEALMKTYFDIGNSTQIFELKSKIHEIK